MSYKYLCGVCCIYSIDALNLRADSSAAPAPAAPASDSQETRIDILPSSEQPHVDVQVDQFRKVESTFWIRLNNKISKYV